MDGIADVQRAVAPPIATGERLTSFYTFKEPLEKRAVSVIEPDITHCGGLTAARRIAVMAEVYGVSVAPHNPQGPVSTAASIEYGFATPNYLICEAVHQDVPWRDEVVIIEWLEEEDFGTTTRGNYLRDLSILYNFSLKREWVASIPLVGISRPTPGPGEIRILSPEDTTEFLSTAQKVAPEIVGPLAIKFFAGLRTSELFALDWTMVNAKQITVQAKTAKTRKRRVVTVSKNLKDWLAKFGEQSGPVTAHTHNAWHRRLEAIKEALNEERRTKIDVVEALEFRLPSNFARHSFCSYHYARHRNENLTAAEAGNSPKVIFSNYRELVSPETAAMYWKIAPN